MTHSYSGVSNHRNITFFSGSSIMSLTIPIRRIQVKALKEKAKCPAALTSIKAVVLVLSVQGSFLSLEDASAATTQQVTISIQGLPSAFTTKVHVNSSYLTSLPGGGSVTIGFNTSVTVSVQQYVPENYHTSIWTPGGALPNSGITFYVPSNTRTFTSSTSHTFTYYALYYLQVISKYGNPMGSGWHAAGSWAPIIAGDIQEATSKVRQGFSSWKGGPLRDSPSNPANAILMDGPKLVEAKWTTQYYFTVESAYGNPTGAGWYNSGAEASFSISTPVGAGEGIRNVFTGWSGDYSGVSPNATLSITAPTRIVAEWRKQYFLSVNPNGGKTDTKSGWVDEGKQIAVTAVTPILEDANNSRLVFTNCKGAVSTTSPTASVSMDSPKELFAEWSRQYLLAVQTEFGKPTGARWYNADSTAEFSVDPATVPAGIWGWAGLEYVFSHWSGDSSSTTPTSSIAMRGPRVVNAVWELSLIKFYMILGAVIVISTSVLLWRRGKLRSSSNRLASLRRWILRTPKEPQ